MCVFKVVKMHPLKCNSMVLWFFGHQWSSWTQKEKLHQTFTHAHSVVGVSLKMHF